MDDRSVPGIDTYASRLIKKKAKWHARGRGFTASDREDIAQELRLHLWRRAPMFDPSIRSWPKWASFVLDKRCLSIRRERMAEKRSPLREEFSLDETVLDCDGRPVARHETIPDRSGVLRRLRELERDVADVLAPLSELHRTIALGLVTGTVNSVANELGLPRSAVERHIEELKVIFEDAGLREYL